MQERQIADLDRELAAVKSEGTVFQAHYRRILGRDPRNTMWPSGPWPIVCAVSFGRSCTKASPTRSVVTDPTRARFATAPPACSGNYALLDTKCKSRLLNRRAPRHEGVFEAAAGLLPGVDADSKVGGSVENLLMKWRSAVGEPRLARSIQERVVAGPGGRRAGEPRAGWVDCHAPRRRPLRAGSSK
jgi:hypothetical protein